MYCYKPGSTVKYRGPPIEGLAKGKNYTVHHNVVRGYEMWLVLVGCTGEFDSKCFESNEVIDTYFPRASHTTSKSDESSSI
jgi:hypothetical protein